MGDDWVTGNNISEIMAVLNAFGAGVGFKKVSAQICNETRQFLTLLKFRLCGLMLESKATFMCLETVLLSSMVVTHWRHKLAGRGLCLQEKDSLSKPRTPAELSRPSANKVVEKLLGAIYKV